MSPIKLAGPLAKTPSVQTLGVLLFGLLNIASSAVMAECIPAGEGELAVVERVYDGDTIKLADGRHVRILGVNAPEVDHGKEKTGQALGEQARRATEDFFKKDKQVRLYYDTERVDRYERTLAHAYNIKGASLAGELLRAGLGFHVAIPPNLSLAECLHNQQEIARSKGLGVWNNAAWKARPAAQLTENDTGFARITGRVVSVRQAQSIWLELDGPIAIKITPSDLPNFNVRSWRAWEGRQIEVRGWVTSSGDDKRKSSSRKKVSQAYTKPLVVQPRISGNLELL